MASALQNDDKVLVFSKDLKTLDIVEVFLGESDWKTHIESLRTSFVQTQLGGWKKGKDYIRIDGSVSCGLRGELIHQFNDEEQVKAFLISSLAGGIGINLVSFRVLSLHRGDV